MSLIFVGTVLLVFFLSELGGMDGLGLCCVAPLLGTKGGWWGDVLGSRGLGGWGVKELNCTNSMMV